MHLMHKDSCEKKSHNDTTELTYLLQIIVNRKVLMYMNILI